MTGSGQIELDPPYQVNVVWNEKQQSLLVDSLIRNASLSPRPFDTAQDDGSIRRVCIDGKQRLTAIQRFIEGEIPWRCKEDKKSYYFRQPPNSRHRTLPLHLQAMVQSTYVTCVELKELTDEQERETFQRVQAGKQLTKDEKLAALTGKHPELVHEVLGRYVACFSGINTLLPWAADRSKDFRMTAEAIHWIAFAAAGESSHSVSKLEVWLSEEDPAPIDPVKKQLVMNVFELYQKIAQDKQAAKKLNRHKTIAPVEFTFIAVFISKYKDTTSLSALVEGIDTMRVQVRAKFTDIKNNDKVKKVLEDFINNFKPPPLKAGEVPLSSLISRKRKRVDEHKRRSESPDLPLSALLARRTEQHKQKLQAQNTNANGHTTMKPPPSPASSVSSGAAARPPTLPPTPRMGGQANASTAAATAARPPSLPSRPPPQAPSAVSALSFSPATLAAQQNEMQDIKPAPFSFAAPNGYSPSPAAGPRFQMYTPTRDASQMGESFRERLAAMRAQSQTRQL
ncbi:hypothetical protein BKA62DRAFT_686855 [Auriculariales sp. MPI-PUGE-AT-0066]|nr:hypothetical protein BKA62DRAFT_686855 [Auriculariales sp. MPI-PUGE-AT-0066]